jgi:creatinine amidohydrolase
VIAPLGSFEQHGPHLPLTTDTDLVSAIADAVERAMHGKALLVPCLWIEPSTHYIGVIQDLCRSILVMGAARVLLLLNGHGGNDVPVRAALREVKTELQGHAGVHVLYAAYRMLAAASIRQIRESELGGLGHACEMETSPMLHLHPNRLRMELARRDGPRHTSPYRKADMQKAKPAYSVNEFHEISERGVVATRTWRRRKKASGSSTPSFAIPRPSWRTC